MTRQRIEFNDRELPFKLSSQSRGVQKAYAGMLSTYGVSEGRRVFLQKAVDQGVGNTIRQKCDSIYTTGRKITRSKKS